MECSICFNTISQETGKAELSCLHTFHLSCLSRWFIKNTSCPCCRHQATITEIMATDSDSDSESDSDESSAPLTYAQLELNASKERARHLFNKLKFFNPIEEVELYSVKFIQSWYRAYKIKRDYNEVKRLRLAKLAILMQLRILRSELGSIYKDEDSAANAFKQRYIYN